MNEFARDWGLFPSLFPVESRMAESFLGVGVGEPSGYWLYKVLPPLQEVFGSDSLVAAVQKENQSHLFVTWPVKQRAKETARPYL